MVMYRSMVWSKTDLCAIKASRTWPLNLRWDLLNYTQRHN